MAGRDGLKALWPGLACAALSTVSGSAVGTVLPPIGVPNGPTIPQNGVLVFSEAVADVSVTLDGTPVLGTLTSEYGWLLWRPDDPFVLGDYVVTTIVLPEDGEGSQSPLTVVEPVMVPDDFVTLDIDQSVETYRLLESACCGLDPGGASTLHLCLDTRRREALRVHVTTAIEQGPVASQVLVRLVELAGAEYPGGYYGAIDTKYYDEDPVETEYCATFEVVDLTDGSIESQEVCVPSIEPELEEIEIPVTAERFGAIGRCVLPPPGYESEWCEGMLSECETSPAELSGSAYESRVSLCADYYGLCGASPPPPAPAPEPEPADEPATLGNDEDESSGCSVSSRQPKSSAALRWMLVLASAWTARRKIARLRRKP